MISNKLDQYKVLNVLGTSGDFTLYKVQDKISEILYLWLAIQYNLDEDTNNILVTEILTRKGLDHKNFLKIFDYIYHPISQTVYIITEYCFYGSLNKAVNNCLKNQQNINESLIWTVLYKLACLIKDNLCQIDDINLENIFLNDHFNIKLLNLRSPRETLLNCSREEICPIEQLGSLIFKLCTLNSTESNKINLNKIPKHYSDELCNMIEFLLHKTDIQPSIDAIICHPTLLINLSAVNEQNLIELSSNNDIKHKNEEVHVDDLQVRIDQLKMRENKLLLKESKMAQRERQLKKRERKVIIAERLVKEKLARAEVYLKSSRSKSTDENVNQMAKDDNSSIYANSEVIKKVSRQKLHDTNVTKRRKNAFRTTTDQTIKFKGHSPLKDIKNNCPRHSQDFSDKNNKRRVLKSAESADWTTETGSYKSGARSDKFGSYPNNTKVPAKLIEAPTNVPEVSAKVPEVITNETTTKSSGVLGGSSDKFATTGRNANVRRSFLNMMFNRKNGGKKKFQESEQKVEEQSRPDPAQMYEEINEFQEEPSKINGCKAILWTEECKKQAFDLLRVINEDEEINSIKHTYL